MKACCKTSEPQGSVKQRVPFMLILIGALVALVAGVVLSDKASAQDGHRHGEQKSGTTAMPTTYAAAVQAIDVRMKNIARLIDAKKLDAVHGEAEVIRDVAKNLAQLALKADSGVPKEAVKEINLAAKALADKFEPIDAAGDSGNLEATKKVYQEMVGLQATLEKYVPQAYQCPMKCEGEKTYPKAGACPVCKMDLEKLTGGKYTVDVKPAEALQAGKSTALVITIKDPRGKPAKDLEAVNGKIADIFMVSKDLSWYAHEHPQMQADGTLKLAVAFPAPGEYFLYHDFTPPAVGHQVVKVPIMVPGQAPPPVALKADFDTAKVVEGYSFMFSAKTPLRAGEESELVFEVTKDGKPVTDLQPVLGAMGHLVVISQDLVNFVHVRPHDEGEEAGHSHGGKGDGGGEHDGHGAKPAAAETSGPDVHFHAHFEAPGLYKGWGQFQHKGKILTVPVVMDVKAGGHAPGKEGGGHKH